jgi:hypothetical protein
MRPWVQSPAPKIEFKNILIITYIHRVAFMGAHVCSQ